MVIGLLGDTHDRADAMIAGLKVLAEAGAEFYIHCGDIGSPEMVDHLVGFEAAFIFGNNDFDRIAVARYAEEVGVACYGNQADLTLDGKRIAVIHGDDIPLKRWLLATKEYDYMFQGHTHIRHDERMGRTRLVNPGALYRANPKTVATVDTATDQVQFFTVTI